jgi:hypothetical protein
MTSILLQLGKVFRNVLSFDLQPASTVVGCQEAKIVMALLTDEISRVNSILSHRDPFCHLDVSIANPVVDQPTTSALSRPDRASCIVEVRRLAA